MVDDKKNIAPEAEMPGEVPQEKKAESVKEDKLPSTGTAGSRYAEAPVVETAPKAQSAPTVES